MAEHDQNHKNKHKKSSYNKNWLLGFHISYGVLKSLLLFVIVLLLWLGSLGIGIGMGYFAYLVKDTEVPTKETLKNEINDIEQVSHMVYANNESIGDITTDLIRTNVKSDAISPYVKKAIVATEDENFWKHHGFVPKATIRALISEALGASNSSGGSTLTQQLVKQQVLTSETTFKRKANELLLAYRVENFFSKQQILTTYLNVSPFGRNNKGENIAGVEEAAKGIFGVHAKDLTLPQAAFIAGLPQSPITYSPYTATGDKKNDLSAGLERKNDVLFNMYREKEITQKEYLAAKSYDLAKDFIEKGSNTSNQNDYLYYYVQKEATEVLMPTYYKADGFKKEDITSSDDLYNKYYKIANRSLRRNGYTVHSTINKELYDSMQATAQNYGHMLDDGRGTIQIGSIMMENSTGKILAFLGGRNYAENQNNHAFDTRRSPASTMKPILAYAPAIDVGLIGSESQLSNFPTTFKSSGGPVTNYDRINRNSFESVRQALKKSDNIPVYNLYQALLTKTNPESYFKKMNIQMSSAEFNYESIPMGGTDHGLTVLEQTNAYATLANGGVYNQGYVIDTITDNNGKVIYKHEQKPVQVYAKATASIMNNLMRDVINSGTGIKAKSTLAQLSPTLAGGDWVGKTGTSQDENDFWFTASTPGITLSSWIGYDNNTPMYSSWGQNNMQFWAYLANGTYQIDPNAYQTNKKFELDASVIKSEVSSFTGQKLGTTTINGVKMQVPGSKVISYFAKDGAANTSFEFGIGGTTANYNTVWAPYLSATKKTTENTKKEEKKAETTTNNAEEEQDENED